jgi:CubicO group peptidase (beta-lactamase class C family)
MLAIYLAAMLASQDTTWAPMARVVDEAIAHRAFPGAVVVIGHHDAILYQHAFGHLDYEHGEPVTMQTVYDLASLTKVIGLTTEMMQLVHEGKVDLDAPAVRYVPAFHDSAVTVRQLLTHSSGLAAFHKWWPQVHSRDDMLRLVNGEPLEQPPGTKMVYSDIGAMLLMEVAEAVSGERIDRYLDSHLFGPLGMTDTRYLPPASWLPRIAPTELDTTYRHRVVRGEVHDENAYSMGGISGHAGLFSTGPDLAHFAQLLLSCFAQDAQVRRRADAPIVDCATVRMFTQVQQPGFSSRALGWDTPSENSSAGSLLSARAFGHTGFTGTSIWIDPEKDLFIILLTNRVYPTRDNAQILGARRAVADTAVQITTRHS